MSNHIAFSSLLGIKKHKFYNCTLEFQLGYYLCEKSDNEFFNNDCGIDFRCSDVFSGDGFLHSFASTLVFSDEEIHE